MIDTALIPVNLARMGVKRRVAEPTADLVTVRMTPYPVLTNYIELCRRLGIKPYGGGSWKKQQNDWTLGWLTSGYRDDLSDGAHSHALAVDMMVGDILEQAKIAREAIDLFTRIGLYPKEKIMHLDLAPRVWTTRYHGVPYWVKWAGQIGTGKRKDYHGFWDLTAAINFAVAAAGH